MDACVIIIKYIFGNNCIRVVAEISIMGRCMSGISSPEWLYRIELYFRGAFLRLARI